MQFFIFGLFLGFYNLELFTAILWLTECVILFISVLCLFYLNVFSDTQKNSFFLVFYKYLGLFISFFFLFFTIDYSYVVENNLFFQSLFLSNDDYYEALYNNKLNDLSPLKSSYYLISSLEFIFAGLLLLIASVVCINFFRLKNNFKLSNYSDFLSLFNLFNDFINSSFLRKQNLIDQNFILSAIRFFKKKETQNYDVISL
ncbi:hypothetical protein [Thauera sp.]|uniref:hypothetical protein n=1 Tax=Thauera sp. TaxID=1905334 RepID=UPI002D0924AE|nr:hypothetical protein [Thauera sp.]HRP26122.1 hypothetical protein [Thauera sp.]